jgi:cytochrome c oxidase subunit 1
MRTKEDRMQATAALPEQDSRYIRWQLYISYVAVALGMLFGLFQALERANIDPYKQITEIAAGMGHAAADSYYRGLTLHGVLNALVFTFAFTNAFLTLLVVRSTGRRIAYPWLLATSFWLTVVGVVLAGWAMLAGEATVLFTFYPPMKAHPLYYLGLTLVVASTWTTSANIFLSARAWKQANPGQRTPLQVFAAVGTYVMWDLCSIGIATEILLLILPWSFGLVAGTDPLLARTLFWLTGHPIVYFWLLPAYISWYTMIPAQVKGKLYSDPLTRLVFVMFLLLSIPVGIHHQYTDPGISPLLKALHGLLTFGVFFPSMITAFSVMAALELGGRARGGQGLFGWIFKLPWGDPSVSSQLLAMLVFTLGGASGLINASYNLNLAIHNTAWVPGHFHLTVGTAVTLSFMGISYWLVPHLTGRQLWHTGLAVAQGWLWMIGVLIMSRGQMWAGLMNVPRRTAIAESRYLLERPEWGAYALISPGMLTAIGGTILFISGLFFLVVVIMTILASRPAVAVPQVPVAEAIAGPAAGWPVLEQWKIWIGISVALILITYGPFLITYTPELTSPGLRVW